MELRIVEMVAPAETTREARKTIENEKILGIWNENMEDELASLRVLLDADQTESISDKLSEKFGNTNGFRIMLFDVEATLPEPKIEEETDKDKQKRLSREELYSDITDGAELTWIYIAMVILATLVAGVGLLLNDVASIIGAMVIAPLLSPNISLALAATLGDTELGWRSLKANVAGLVISLAVAVIMGLIFSVDVGSRQIASHTMVNLKQIIIALAAGSAGVLAFTRGVSAMIVGVMVAVALLPPLVDFGLLLGGGYIKSAVGAGILTVTNLICINLAGIVTFLIQGVRPREWWEEQKAEKAARTAIIIWLILLIIFGFIIWYWGQLEGHSSF
ncbi:MAG TPA: TIGR00341 family protein [Balneolaceae bacterium]|nr:TIGR00341 family protein [Balneolaceae bacterium]